MCTWCAAWVTDEHGVPVSLYNVSFSGGFTAQYDDGRAAERVTRDGRVRIGGAEFTAGETRMGGTVVQALAVASDA